MIHNPANIPNNDFIIINSHQHEHHLFVFFIIWYVSRIMDHIIKSDVIIEFNRNLFSFRKTIQNLQQKKLKVHFVKKIKGTIKSSKKLKISLKK